MSDESMSDESMYDTSAEFEKALTDKADETYVLRLYITGATPRSARAIASVRQICDEYLHGRYELEVIDLYQQPELAEHEQIIAAPTLIKKLPPPLRRIIGDMSKSERLLVGLDLRTKSQPDPETGAGGA